MPLSARAEIPADPPRPAAQTRLRVADLSGQHFVGRRGGEGRTMISSNDDILSMS
jgi:hypothetical protein